MILRYRLLRAHRYPLSDSTISTLFVVRRRSSSSCVTSSTPPPTTIVDPPRVRFAPSPTGSLHLGGLRTALYNYLFAKRHRGTFILRIEDTDQTRFVPGSAEVIQRSLDWAGITPDEGPYTGGTFGPYVQSQRLHLYQEAATRLIASGAAYKCFCSQERLQLIRSQARVQGTNTTYDGRCRHLLETQVTQKIKSGERFTVRLNVDYCLSNYQSVQSVSQSDTLSSLSTSAKCNLSLDDLVYGTISFDKSTIDDQVLLKSDGFPTYHLAVVVDDDAMKITHVIRGEEWLSSTPKHLLLFSALGLLPPQYAHLPLLLNPDRSKLSKRSGDVAVSGYEPLVLPSSLLQFIAGLGWTPSSSSILSSVLSPSSSLQSSSSDISIFDSSTDIIPLSSMASLFSFLDVGRSGAIVDMQKLWSINNKHMMYLSKSDDGISQLCQLFMKQLDSSIDVSNISVDYFRRVIDLQLPRFQKLNQVSQDCSYFFNKPNWKVEEICKILLDLKLNNNASKVVQLLQDVSNEILNLNSQLSLSGVLDSGSIHEKIQQCGRKLGINKPWLVIRWAITGETMGAEIPRIVAVLGANTSSERLLSVARLIQAHVTDNVLKE